ncbi:MAG TPA: sulfatase [Candidatus Dormibacteraeota bacterium]|jgi:arylsulfatase A-like enzyme|nr:sulfatase [Candidatus Dormibacteraeota bacterium]
MSDTRPDIVLLISHDTGRRLGCYGRGVATPNLDAVAAQGLRFDRAFTTAPQCSPSRAGLITGMVPHRTGMLGLAHLGFDLDPSLATLPALLAGAGYRTVLCGTEHEGSRRAPDHHGYQEVMGPAGGDAGEVAETVLTALPRLGAGEPFYLCAGFFQTHRPFPEPAAGEEVEVPPYLPDRPGVRHDLAGFQASLRELDSAVGAIAAAVAALPRARDTLLIYTTDHGIAFPGAKGTLHDPGLEIALIARWPARLTAGGSTDALVSNVDLLPTLCELAGADAPAGIDGRSLVPVLEGGASVREEIFAEVTWHDAYQPVRGIRTEGMAYIRHLRPGPTTYLPIDIHESPAGQEVRETFYQPRSGPEELYDLAQDPLQERNLIGDEAYRERHRTLARRLEEWRLATRDPMLEGDVQGREAPGWAEERRAGRIPSVWDPA